MFGHVAQNIYLFTRSIGWYREIFKQIYMTSWTNAKTNNFSLETSFEKKNIQQVEMVFRTKRRLAGALLHLRTVFATGGFPTKIVKILCNLENNTHIYLNWTTTWPCQKILNGCLFVCRIKEWLADFLFCFIDSGSNAFFFRAIFCQTMLL